MDFRVLHSGNENNISNDDVMFMQYSNYFGLNAIGKGIDESNEGITIQGCQLIATYNQADDTITAGISDGYIVIDGKQIKCEATASIQFTCQYFMGYRRTSFIFAEVESRFNILGNKNYDDGQTKDTWKEDRIKLSYSFSSTPIAGTVLIGSALASGAQGGTPSPIVVLQTISSISQAIIKNTGNGDILTTHRGGRPDECVSVSNLYDVVQNYSYIKIYSSTKTIDINNNLVFQFTLPNDTVDAFLVSCKAKKTGETGNVWYGNRPTTTGTFTPDGNLWFVNLDTKKLYVSFDTNIGEFAYAIIAISRV